MADDRLAWKFRRAARQRLKAVDLVMEYRHNFEAMYLAGYVVECGLKALLLARTPVGDRAELVRQVFKGRRGHDFNWLRRLLGEKGCTPSPDILDHFLSVSSWSTALRYEPGVVLKVDAVAFVVSAERILRWTERST